MKKPREGLAQRICSRFVRYTRTEVNRGRQGGELPSGGGIAVAYMY